MNAAASWLFRYFWYKTDNRGRRGESLATEESPGGSSDLAKRIEMQAEQPEV
jgi:hypothetical protein